MGLVCLFLAGGAAGAEDEAGQPDYAIKAPEIVLPEGVALGQYRRIIQPFENWILICDENLQDMQRVCNVSQSIVDREDEVVFSWSMAASEDGRPFMIMRAPRSVGAGGRISLRFGDRETPVQVRLDACDDELCMAVVPVGKILREQIAKAATPRVSYATTLGEDVTVDAPLRGLTRALSAIDR